MIRNLGGKHLWSQGPVCKLCLEKEDKWHFLWTWAHCILWSSRPYRMFLVQKEKKGDLKMHMAGRNWGSFHDPWLDLWEPGEAERCQWPLCLTEAVPVQGQAQPRALPPCSLGIWPKWACWICSTHQTGLFCPKRRPFTLVLERN